MFDFGFKIEKGVLKEYKGKKKSVFIPKSVHTIAPEAFICNEVMESVTIPESVSVIGNDAFAVCNNLASVSIPDSVRIIGNGAFRDCR